MLGLGIWVKFVWVLDHDLDRDCLRGLKVCSESWCVLANSNEYSWSFLDCVFGLVWVRSGVELGLGLRKHVCLIVSLDLGVLRLGSARC